jgi:hypothetical protein
MAKIGIRLADGKFYPILEDGAASKKRLVVTTVKDDQPSVQIDVYRSTVGEAADDYVGSLVIENIPPRPSGEPDIRLELGLDDDGNLNALAREEATGEHQTLSVSLKSLAEEEKYDIPDFDFQEDEGVDLSTDEFPEVNPFDTEAPEAGETVDSAEAIPDFGEPEPSVLSDEEKKRTSPLLIGILAAIGLIIILLLAFLIYKFTVDRKPEPPVAPATFSAPGRGTGPGGQAGGHGQEGRHLVQDQVGRHAVGPVYRLLSVSLALPDHRQSQQNKESRPHHLGYLDIHPSEIGLSLDRRRGRTLMRPLFFIHGSMPGGSANASARAIVPQYPVGVSWNFWENE